MKKNVLVKKSLVLARETIRRLATDRLNLVWGGQNEGDDDDNTTTSWYCTGAYTCPVPH